MHSLPVLLRLAGRTVILLGDGDAADARRRMLERAGALVVTDEAAPDAAVAFVAMAGDAARAAADRLRGRGLLVNVVDRAELCDFTIPAIVERGPVVVAIGTGGASAGLAKALRMRLEARFPETLGALAEGLAAARGAMRARWPNAIDRRHAIDAALASGGVLDALSEHPADAVDRWLDSDSSAAEGAGRLEKLRIASADPDELTLRAARLLGHADALWHRGDIPPAILGRARADAVRHIAAAPPDVPARGLHLWLEGPQ